MLTLRRTHPALKRPASLVTMAIIISVPEALYIRDTDTSTQSHRRLYATHLRGIDLALFFLVNVNQEPKIDPWSFWNMEQRSLYDEKSV
jgi:hypothetical protein